MHPAANVSQRLVRYVFKVDSMNGGNVLTAALILQVRQIFLVVLVPVVLRFHLSRLGGGLSRKKVAVVQSCGISQRFCHRSTKNCSEPETPVVVKMFIGWTCNRFPNTIRFFCVANLFRQVVSK